MVATVLLLALVAVASITDLLWHKIYNWTTYSGILAAFGSSAAGWALLAAGWATESRLRWLGWISPAESFLGLLACGGLMLLCLVFFDIGGGDVKLIAMLGAAMGWEKGLEAMLWTFILGGCLALIVLVWRVGPWRLVAGVFRQVVWALRLGRWSPLGEAQRAELHAPLFLAPSALVAVAIVRFGLVERF
jgi:Flp pilus assembly protein protease CpaA